MGDYTEWVAIILDENRRVAFFDLAPAIAKATFADDGFIVSVVRDSARPGGYGLAYTPQTAFFDRDVAFEVECQLHDPADDQLSLRTRWARARVMAAALNAAEQYTADSGSSPSQVEGGDTR